MTTGVVRKMLDLAHLLKHGEAVHVGHGNIEENKVGENGGGSHEGIRAIARLVNFATLGLEGLRDDHTDHPTVIDGQDFVAHRSSGGIPPAQVFGTNRNFFSLKPSVSRNDATGKDVFSFPNFIWERTC